MHRITPKVARRGAATPSWDDRRVRAANPEPFRNPPGCERRLAAVEGQGTLCVLRGSNESGRPGSNRRRPAWEAGILPLNYARTELRRYLAEPVAPRNPARPEHLHPPPLDAPAGVQ